MNLHLRKPQFHRGAGQRGARVPRPHVSLRAIFPNLLTTVALCSGLASLHFSTNAKWDQALACIAVAAIFDTLDGRAARLLRVSSKFGAVLDSLSDFLCFGVAPALMLHQWLLEEKEFWGLAACMTYALCAALRLARFTAAAPARPEEAPLATFFTGMPSPAAAGAVLIPIMLAQSEIVKFRIPDIGVIAYTFFVGWLMVSRRPMYSFKKVRLHRHAVVPLLALIGVLVFAATKHPWLVTSGIAGVYLLTLPIAHVKHARVVASLRAAGVLVEPGGTPAVTDGQEIGNAGDEHSVARGVSGSRTSETAP